MDNQQSQSIGANHVAATLAAREAQFQSEVTDMNRRHSINREASMDYLEYLLDVQQYDENGILNFAGHKIHGGLAVVDTVERAKKDKMLRKMRARRFDMRYKDALSAWEAWELSTEVALETDWEDGDGNGGENRNGSGGGDDFEVIADAGNAESNNGGSAEAT